MATMIDYSAAPLGLRAEGDLTVEDLDRDFIRVSFFLAQCGSW
jgi:hypothetical protein